MAIRASFDDANSLVIEMTAKISVYQNTNLGGGFEGSLKLNSAFNGTEQLSLISKKPDRHVPTLMLDEYYRGAFSLVKALTLSATKTSGGGISGIFPAALADIAIWTLLKGRTVTRIASSTAARLFQRTLTETALLATMAALNNRILFYLSEYPAA